MKLTVLGKYGPFPPRGGATSGYLVQEDDVNLVLDFGSGVLSRLQGYIAIGEINAVLLSHLHSDHIVDLYVLAYALNLLYARGVDVPLPLKVFSPPEPEAEFKRLSQLGVYDMIAIEHTMKLRLGELEISFHPMTHPAPSYGFNISAKGRRLFYTGDTSFNKGIVPSAKGANLLLADANILEAGRGSDLVPHLTAYEVGKIAKEANVERLLCTHIWPGYSDERVIAEAAENYPSAEAATELMTYVV